MKQSLKGSLAFILGMIALIFSLPLLTWGFWPPRRATQMLPLQPPPGLPPLNGRTLRLTYSPLMRLGDSQRVELTLAGADAADASVFEWYNVIAEARLDLAPVAVRPGDILSTALTEGRDATFYWEITPSAVGGWSGTVWLYLRFVPKAGGAETRQPVSAQHIGINSTSMLGWGGTGARVLGVAGSLVGLSLLLVRNAFFRRVRSE